MNINDIETTANQMLFICFSHTLTSMFSADSYKTKSVKLELLTLTIFLTLLHGSLGHPTGADAGRCDSMIPGHGEYQPTLSNSYNVDVSAESYRCGESLTGKLSKISVR